MMCSYVSIASTRMRGVDDFVVDRRGSGRFMPQSPRARDDCGVVIVWRTGCIRVAVSEEKIACDESWSAGLDNLGGIAKILEARRRAPPGDTVRVAIVAVAIEPRDQGAQIRPVKQVTAVIDWERRLS